MYYQQWLITKRKTKFTIERWVRTKYIFNLLHVTLKAVTKSYSETGTDLLQGNRWPETGQFDEYNFRWQQILTGYSIAKCCELSAPNSWQTDKK